MDFVRDGREEGREEVAGAVAGKEDWNGNREENGKKKRSQIKSNQ